MTNNTQKILRAYYEMPDSEKNEFKKAITEFESKGYSERRSMSENLSKALNLGPLSSNGCPVCGK